MITPTEYSSVAQKQIDGIITMIDDEIRRYQDHPWYDWVFVVIPGNEPVHIRDAVAKKYVEAGWKKVCHKTSAENGERAGLVEYVLLTDKTEDAWEKAFGEGPWHRVTV